MWTVVPVFVCGGVAAAIFGRWWLLVLSVTAVLLLTRVPWRLDVDDRDVRISFPFGIRSALVVPRSATRFTYDSTELYIDRLDGGTIGRRSASMSLIVFSIGGPPSVVLDLRSIGVHVERV